MEKIKQDGGEIERLVKMVAREQHAAGQMYNLLMNTIRGMTFEELKTLVTDRKTCKKLV